MAEVRDEKARQFQQNFPLEIRVREPTTESLQVVTQFSKLTGDFTSLSVTDLKVMALVYTIEKEAHGNVNHIRKIPVQADKPDPKANNNQLPGMGAFDNDNDGWITPNNVKQCINASEGEIKDSNISSSIKVACITTDFAIQNVLKQMMMNVISVDGLLIKRIRRYVLRCIACYKICRDLTKIFCPHCGYNSLKKLSYSIDEAGDIRYHFNPKFRPSLKGTKYPLPGPKPGRDKSGDLILCEQQLPRIPRKKQVQGTEMMNEITFGELERTLQAQKPVIGFGKRNPNEPKKKFGKKNKARTKRNN